MSNQGKKVKTHYRGTLDDGTHVWLNARTKLTQFDSSYDRGEPLEFTCGAGQMIKGFDAAVVDMQVGEKKTVHIPAVDAYGERNPEMVITFPAEQVPNIEQIEKGQPFIYTATERHARPRRGHRCDGRGRDARRQPRARRQGPQL